MSQAHDALDRLRQAPTYKDLAQAFKKRKRVHWHWGGLWGSSKSFLCCALNRDLEAPLLVITADMAVAESVFDDFSTFGTGVVMFPARQGKLGAEPEVLRDRFHALDRLERDGFRGVVLAPLAALLQPVPQAGQEDVYVELSEGKKIDPEELMRLLVQAGFERVPAIHSPGEMARRGDILDFFAPAIAEPLRLEFFDDELESIRVFDIATQRTRHVLKHVRVPLVQDLPEVAGEADLLPQDRFPKDLRVVRYDAAALDDMGQKLRYHGPAYHAALQRLENYQKRHAVVDLVTLPGQDATLDTLSVEEYCRGVVDGVTLLAERCKNGEQAVICCATKAESDRLEQIFADEKIETANLYLWQGGLVRGFRMPEIRLTILHHRELIPGHGAHRPKPRHQKHQTAGPLETVLALKPGDLVVHAVHGLSRFRGIERLPGAAERELTTGLVREGESGQDALLLEFADEALLHVPVARVDLVERYIGAGGGTPQLDRLGSGAFERRRRKVQTAVEDLAAEMLQIQAQRLSTPGTSFPPVDEEQRKFEASFPFEDTPDQAQGTRDIHEDLSAPRATDRLVCGDVGYGKTELAARAAFRVVMAGYQVAILVPTTVLAEQHWRSFRERFANWPFRIEQLSRIRPTAERKQTLADMEKGLVDIVIGTHRLLSNDVLFKKLGLVVIDEEQRFGVRAKEQLKKKRATVDVLTLTATPVPRTLHMAFAGLRDITSLTTAPVGRLEVHTELRYEDESQLIAEALRQELERGGQAFFVHNRVKSLDRIADKIRKLVPGANVETGHGQMEPRALEKAMLKFVRGKADILCSTTIVESGLDIPNANTIFIHDAQNYGLADLHQLRGRVGRSTQRGYCYLLIPRGKPLSQDSRRRLKAVEELRYLGAGFQVAMRDLEIRGAGNLLGPEQSGHIAAVGYETYRRLLSQAVTRMRRTGEISAKQNLPAADVSLGVQAAVPPAYVPDEELRLEILREFDRIRAPENVDAVLEALQDRFGPPPPEVVALAKLFFLKHRLGELGLDQIQRVDDRLVCSLRDAKLFEKALRKTGVDLRIITARKAHWVLPKGVDSSPSVLDHLFSTVGPCLPPHPRRTATASK